MDHTKGEGEGGGWSTNNLPHAFNRFFVISCGVPQGYISGQLLFILYIHDIVQAVNCDLLLYAYDTGLTFQHKGACSWNTGQ